MESHSVIGPQSSLELKIITFLLVHLALLSRREELWFLTACRSCTGCYPHAHIQRSTIKNVHLLLLKWS